MRRRRVGLLLIFGAAIPLVVAATAWACANLTTLRLDTRAAAPGTDVSGVGRNYSSAGSLVTVRLGRKGPVLWEGPPAGSRGKITPTFKVPAVKPGSYVIVATQSTATGSPVAGTPGRASLRIKRATAGSSQAPASTSWASPRQSRPGGPEAAPAAGNADARVLPALMGIVLSLALLGSGLALVGRARAAYRPLGATTPKSG